MVDIAPIQTLNHKLSWIPKVFAHFEGFFIDVLGREVLSDAAVVSVAQFGLVDAIIKQIVHIHVVNIALYLLVLLIAMLLIVFLFLLFFRT